MQLINILFPLIFTIVILGITFIYLREEKNKDYSLYLIGIGYLIVSLFVNSMVIMSIEKIASADVEIWSGRITEVYHKEEWDEWHPPEQYEDTEYYYENGEQKSRTVTKIRPGYWEHHYAQNKIKTSDDGWINVKKSPDGTVSFNDKYPNTEQELMKYYPVGQATASFHNYDNKLQFSKSLFKAGEVDKTLIEQLPDYPNKINSDFSIDRFLGEVDNKEKINNLVDEWNAKLNTEPLNKQVNVIFVNLGDLPMEYGYALEAKWEGANKNDFVISFSMVNNEIKWVYPFSWTEIEILKINIRDYMLDNKNVTDFSSIIDKTCNMIATDFERKEMADYSYIKYQHGTGSYFASFIACLILFVLLVFFIFHKDNYI